MQVLLKASHTSIQLSLRLTFLASLDKSTNTDRADVQEVYTSLEFTSFPGTTIKILTEQTVQHGNTAILHLEEMPQEPALQVLTLLALLVHKYKY